MLKNYSTANQARIVTALILTSILSIGSGLTFIKNATAASTNLLPETTNEVLKQNIKSNRLPRPVANAVLRDLARRQGIFTSQLKIINYSQQTWRNGCLELPQPDELCTQALVPGWRVVVSNNRQNWIYHTNSNGRSLRLGSENTSSDNSPSQLPASVKNTVLQAASRRLQLPISRLTIIQAQQRTWRDGCLELGNINELCIAALTPGWRVVIGAVDQTLVYHSNQTGSVIRLNERASGNAVNQLPQKVRYTILQKASQVSGLPTGALNIIESTRKTWQPFFYCPPTADCIAPPAQISGWQVVVEAGEDRWIYLTDETASMMQLSAQGLPVIGDAILRQASVLTGLPTKALNIVGYKRTKFASSCDREASPSDSRSNLPNLCDPIVLSGWKVSVKPYNQRNLLVFLSDNSGSRIQLASGDSSTGNNGTGQPVPIPSSELPPPLDRGVVFRQISSGGFAGRTYETVLLNDGSLIRVRIGDANDSERSVRRISRQEVQRFQQLLERSRFGEYKNLSYPAPSGAADYIIYTLTSREGTVQYNDISQNNLPQNLQVVVKAWNQITNSQVSNGNTDETVPIPASELPPPLDRGVVFRQISSGGLFPRTYETVLLNDGRLIRVRIGDANDSERSVHRISIQQVQQFEQLLERSEFGEYKNLSYPAPSGAADYITYTLTSQEGTVQYNDISQNNLPESLREVVNNWNQIVSNAQR
nr:hypothetical protein [Dendronalium sp. ChiSLP03b]